MQVTVFGLGEAGSSIAEDLARSDLEVVGYDPADVSTPSGVRRLDDPTEAVRGCSVVLAVTAAADAGVALIQAISFIPASAVYADLSTATPDLKCDLERTAVSAGLRFADVALMAPVPGNGLATPALSSGPGAAVLADLLNRHGASIRVVGGAAGNAAAHKLLRSIVTKGLTSLIIESLRAAESHGSTDWLWGHIVETVTGADEALVSRLLDGTPPHVDRRIEEMEAVASFLESLQVDPTMTRATISSLQSVKRSGLPQRTTG